MGSGSEPSRKMSWMGSYGLLLSAGLRPSCCEASKAPQFWAGKLLLSSLSKKKNNKWDHPGRLREFTLRGRRGVSRMEAARRNVRAQNVVYCCRQSVRTGSDLESLTPLSHPLISSALYFCLDIFYFFLFSFLKPMKSTNSK